VVSVYALVVLILSVSLVFFSSFVFFGVWSGSPVRLSYLCFAGSRCRVVLLSFRLEVDCYFCLGFSTPTPPPLFLWRLFFFFFFFFFRKMPLGQLHCIASAGGEGGGLVSGI